MEHANEYVLRVDFGSTNSRGKKTDAETTEKEEENMAESGAEKQIRSFFKKVVVAGVAGEVFSWQVSLVGRNTGSSLVQEKINASMQIAGAVGGVLLGFKTGGLVGGAMATAAVGIKLIKDVEQYNYNARWENVSTTLSRERVGSSAAINRSRNV